MLLPISGRGDRRAILCDEVVDGCVVVDHTVVDVVGDLVLNYFVLAIEGSHHTGESEIHDCALRGEELADRSCSFDLKLLYITCELQSLDCFKGTSFAILAADVHVLGQNDDALNIGREEHGFEKGLFRALDVGLEDGEQPLIEVAGLLGELVVRLASLGQRR